MNKKFTLQEVLKHNNRNDLWTIYKNKVYNVTSYFEEHPGGEDTILEFAGIDCTQAFDEVRHDLEAFEILRNLFIGDLENDDIVIDSLISKRSLITILLIALILYTLFCILKQLTIWK